MLHTFYHQQTHLHSTPFIPTIQYPLENMIKMTYVIDGVQLLTYQVGNCNRGGFEPNENGELIFLLQEIQCLKALVHSNWILWNPLVKNTYIITEILIVLYTYYGYIPISHPCRQLGLCYNHRLECPKNKFWLYGLLWMTKANYPISGPYRVQWHGIPEFPFWWPLLPTCSRIRWE